MNIAFSHSKNLMSSCPKHGEKSRLFGIRINPAIQITSIKLLNEHTFFDAPYSRLKAIDLDYDYQFASLTFAALDYRRPSSISYRYRIDGIHEEWINLGSNRQVSISGLGYGNYRLRLGATNSGQRWSSLERVVTLSIAPPLWMTCPP